jgi:hypothetical protein
MCVQAPSLFPQTALQILKLRMKFSMLRKARAKWMKSPA